MPVSLLLSFSVVALERSTHYVEAAAVTGVAVALLAYAVILPSSRRFQLPPTALSKEHCGQLGPPSPGIPGSVTPFPVLPRLLSRG
jgi:hypothetical protein